MNQKLISLFTLVIPLVFLSSYSAQAQADAKWNLNATLIEACSCPLFCQYLFSPTPASQGDTEHFCKFNRAFWVNRGNYNGVKLDGAKYWIAGDLGGDMASGKFDWAVLTFDSKVSQEQRDGIMAILVKLYPGEWESFILGADAEMTWYADKSKAVASLDRGKTAEMILTPAPSMTDDPVVIKNLKYWGASDNDGFEIWPNEVEAYRIGDKAFEFRGTNGFMITVEISSKDT
jgi:hypothetical protein